MGHGGPVLVHLVLKGRRVHNRPVDKTQTDRMGVNVGGSLAHPQRQRDSTIAPACVTQPFYFGGENHRRYLMSYTS